MTQDTPPVLTDKERKDILDAIDQSTKGIVVRGNAYLDDELHAIHERVLAGQRRLISEHPFFGAISTRLEVIHANWPCAFATNGIQQFYGPEFVDQSSDDDIDYGLANNAAHLILGHIERRGDRNPHLWNIANDILINDLLVKEGFKPVKVAISDPRFSIDTHTSEEVYDIIFAEHQKGELSFGGVPTKLPGEVVAKVDIGPLLDEIREGHNGYDEAVDISPTKEELEAAQKETSKAVENLRNDPVLGRFAPDPKIKG